MIRKLLLPALALGMLAFSINYVVQAQQATPKVSPPVQPPKTPFNKTVAGAGLVEARTENIAIGSHLPGIVDQVMVEVGAKVAAGAPLFRLDDRQTQADLKVRQANLAAAEAELTKLESMPRPEELPPAEATLKESQASLVEQKAHLERTLRLDSQGASTEQDVIRHRQAVLMTEQQVAKAQANYDLLNAGAWEPDKAMARAKVEQARAEVAQVQTELDRLLVCAPMDGEVLQVNVRPGEFVGAPPGQALVVLGNVQSLHVRVDIDENDIPRFRPGAPAKATLRGDPQQSFDLVFKRVEPYVVPKKSLTGDNTERVDTRVLQVIYELEPGPMRLYVGQQVDVFVDAAEPVAPVEESHSAERPPIKLTSEN
jgi:multidrug resistance efflux pump